MADGIRKVIAYYIENLEDAGGLPVPVAEQQAAIAQYIKSKNDERVPNPSPYGGAATITWEVAAEFTEVLGKKQKQFSSLDASITEARRTGAQLIIARLQNMTRNEIFAQTLINSKLDFLCLDQPLINRATLPAIIENFRQMRMMHSARIRKGLEQTMAKLGNPNALKEITKVNKPKTENAVMFALMLAPIVQHYRAQGYSQRKMVDALNHDGFMAPEGGKWVLSQLQKVLERIDLNTVALDLAASFDEFIEKQYTDEQQVKALTAMNARAPARGTWDLDALHKVQERLHMLREIMAFNQFVIDVFPQLLDDTEHGLSDEEIAEKLNHEGIDIPERVLWEIKHEEVEIPADKSHHWDSEDIALARSLAERRKQDIDHYVNPNTLSKAIDLVEEHQSKSEGE